MRTIWLGRASTAGATTPSAGLQETANEIGSRGGKGIPIACDHKNDEQVKALFDRIKRDTGRLDVLVNNAFSAVNVSFLLLLNKYMTCMKNLC